MINYYTVLQVPNFAPEEEVKKSYRKLSKVWHPDMNNGSAYHAEKFREIQAAYECLSKPDTRSWYDDRLNNYLNGFEEETTSGAGYHHSPYTSYQQPSYQNRNPEKRSTRWMYPGVFYILYLFARMYSCNTTSYMDTPTYVPVTNYQYNKTAQEILDSFAKAARADTSELMNADSLLRKADTTGNAVAR